MGRGGVNCRRGHSADIPFAGILDAGQPSAGPRSALSLPADGANHQNRLRKKLIMVKRTAIDAKNNAAVTKGSYAE
jgi:hypothetical protein